MERVSVVRSGTFREICLGAKSFRKMVGAPRFELGTSWSRTKRATRLRYAPKNRFQVLGVRCQQNDRLSPPEHLEPGT